MYSLSWLFFIRNILSLQQWARKPLEVSFSLLPVLLFIWCIYINMFFRLVLTLRTKSCHVDCVDVCGGVGAIIRTCFSAASGDRVMVVAALGCHWGYLCVKLVYSMYTCVKYQIKIIILHKFCKSYLFKDERFQSTLEIKKDTKVWLTFKVLRIFESTRSIPYLLMHDSESPGHQQIWR